MSNNPIRTDVQMVGGRVVGKPNGADTSKPLPKVEGTDLLQSDAWGESWKKQAGEPDNAIEALAQAQGEISRSFKSFMEVREKRNPDETQSLHLKTLTQDYDRAFKRLASQSDSAVERANARLAEIDSQFKEHVKWNDRDAAELRAVMRGMDDKQRANFIDNALQNGDGQAMGAFLGAHPSLSGITADMQKAYRARAMQLHTPKLLNLERTIEKAVGQVRNAFSDFAMREEDITARKLREEYAAKEREAYEARKRAVGDDGRWG